MNQLHLHLSNRQEVLVRKLADLLAQPLCDPFEPEIVVVQSRGMERWISMRLAEANAIAANLSFPFPVSFTFDVFQRVLPRIARDDLFEQTLMTWRIADVLPELVDRPDFAPVQQYLSDAHPLKLIQLAEKLAFLFDQYIIFRPEMVLAWDKGHAVTGSQHEPWQAELWRAISPAGPAQHRAALKQNWAQRLQTGLPDGLLPERVSFFGVSSLPPYYLEFLDELSAHCPVHLFFLNPCRQYWSDTFREARDLRKKSIVPVPENGNELLTSWGELGGDFLHSIYAQDLNPREDDAYADPGRDTLLASIQSDILDQTGPSAHGKRPSIKADDTSLRIHSCHSPMREMEVLKDDILDLLQRYPELEPRDIVVMTPDIETYAPYIQAVFDAPGSDEIRLPYSIADRDQGKVSAPTRTFLDILDLASSKMTASQIVSLLESPPVMGRFAFSQADLELFRHWIEGTGIKWGIDAAHREHLGLPGFDENTWRAGLDRLILGYALSDVEEQPFKSILPSSVEGETARTLGRLLRAVDSICNIASNLDTDRTLSQWRDFFLDLIQSLIEGHMDFEQQCADLRQSVNQLAEEAERAGYAGRIGLKTIRHLLRNRFKRQGVGRRFITGGITFCSMLPMRSIPFTVVCLVGLDNESFPRKERPQGFDLMSESPQPGDRSKRLDDRYLFLEAILAARKFLRLSFRGQNIDDNASVPPSVLVSELMDYIRENYRPAQEHASDDGLAPDLVDDHLLIQHRLQAFHPEYFHPHSTLFSYSQDNLDGARGLLSQDREPPFFATPLDPPDSDWRNITLEDLAGFLIHPARFLLQRRLGFTPAPRHSLITDEEPLTGLDPLTRYTMGQRLTQRILQGRDQGSYQLLRSGQQLPPGTLGDVAFDRLFREADSLAHMVNEQGDRGDPNERLPFELQLGDFTLQGHLEEGSAAGLRYRFARLKARDLLAAWPEHLALNATARQAVHTTTLIGLEGSTWVLEPVENARDVLHDMLRLMHEGMCHPLPFFPETSMAYASSRLRNSKSHSEAMAAALRKWRGFPPVAGEGEDPSVLLCFRGLDPLGEDFSKLATTVFSPLFASWSKR